MPLRDHFRPPLDDLRHWEGFHAAWPVMIVAQLRRKLPRRYFVEPWIRPEPNAAEDTVIVHAEDEEVWAPPRPTFSVVTDLPIQDAYEVRVYDERRRCRLVAAVELVSPANKDRPEHRRAFVSKCVGLLRDRVSVVIVDVVTTRTQNLYEELLDHLGQSNAAPDPPLPLYTAACRLTKPNTDWLLETWAQSLTLGQLLPTVPLWLADDLAIPLELEESYEQSCNILDIP
jgi:hypothetical protein